jgi:hypothetical protein
MVVRGAVIVRMARIGNSMVGGGRGGGVVSVVSCEFWDLALLVSPLLIVYVPGQRKSRATARVALA